MTYKDKYNELLAASTATWNKFLEVDKELSSINGFGDSKLLPAYNTAYNDCRYAQANFDAFVNWLRGKNVNPDDEMPILNSDPARKVVLNGPDNGRSRIVEE